MSHELPARPSLDFLKKTAKRRLREIQRQDPAAKLADAFHEVARDYGFPSWTGLKAHVESLDERLTAAAVAPPPGGGGGGGAAVSDASGGLRDDGPNFHRYTDRAKRATFFSRYEAGRFGSPAIEPEHLLLGIVQARQGLTSDVFASARASLADLRTEIEHRSGTKPSLPTSVIIPFSAGIVRIIRFAAEEANRLEHHHIGTVHLLMGVLQAEDSLAASILKDHGLLFESICGNAETFLDEEGV